MDRRRKMGGGGGDVMIAVWGPGQRPAPGLISVALHVVQLQLDSLLVVVVSLWLLASEWSSLVPV